MKRSDIWCCSINNQAIDDFANGVKEIMEDNMIYNMDCIDTLVKQLRKN